MAIPPGLLLEALRNLMCALLYLQKQLTWRKRVRRGLPVALDCLDQPARTFLQFLDRDLRFGAQLFAQGAIEKLCEQDCRDLVIADAKIARKAEQVVELGAKLCLGD